jgi:hypothetical protein
MKVPGTFASPRKENPVTQQQAREVAKLLKNPAAWKGAFTMFAVTALFLLIVTHLPDRVWHPNKVVVYDSKWNVGAIYLWSTRNIHSAERQPVPEYTSCKRLDGETYTLDFDPPIHLYLLSCGLITGYVRTHQVHYE